VVDKHVSRLEVSVYLVAAVQKVKSLQPLPRYLCQCWLILTASCISQVLSLRKQHCVRVSVDTVYMYIYMCHCNIEMYVLLTMVIAGCFSRVGPSAKVDAARLHQVLMHKCTCMQVQSLAVCNALVLKQQQPLAQTLQCTTST
jgi:hypothetical protein